MRRVFSACETQEILPRPNPRRRITVGCGSGIESERNQLCAIRRRSSAPGLLQFRKATGLSFTEFVSRTRVEQAKKLLLNPNLRISEVAFAVGFQSISNFNRMFKRIVGRSPTYGRDQLVAVI
ncbi:MAG: helix-turn-helix transcriptional regulator [Verrucomicrobiota bacterium]